MESDLPNIRHLRVFLKVVEYKSINKASQVVYLSQPAVTQAIVKLEKSLNAHLFNRRSDGMYVTESGTIYANRVERALELLLQGLKASLKVGSENTSQASHILKLLTTTQLKALVAVSEAQNFTIAGRNLGISQSSLHRAARDLESLLGVVLFEKTSIGISASKAALIISKATKMAFTEIAQGKEEVFSVHQRDVGKLIVGSMPLARTSILPKALIEFFNVYPDYSISINDGPYNDLLYHLRSGDIDLLIGALRFPSPSEDIIQEELFVSNIEIAARSEHPLFNEKDINVTHLNKYPWIVPRKGTPTRALFEKMFEDNNLSLPSRIVESGSQNLIRSFLNDSDYLTMISENQIQYEVSSGLLRILNIGLSQFSRPIGLTMRKNWKPTKTQLTLIDFLREKAIEHKQN